LCSSGVKFSSRWPPESIVVELLVAIQREPRMPQPDQFGSKFIRQPPEFSRRVLRSALPLTIFLRSRSTTHRSFLFVDEAGHRQAVVHHDSGKCRASDCRRGRQETPNFLVDDGAARIAKKPVCFHLKAQLATPATQTKTRVKPWPDYRGVTWAC